MEQPLEKADSGQLHDSVHSSPDSIPPSQPMHQSQPQSPDQESGQDSQAELQYKLDSLTQLQELLMRQQKEIFRQQRALLLQEQGGVADSDHPDANPVHSVLSVHSDSLHSDSALNSYSTSLFPQLPQQSSWSFTQGLVVGQLSVIVLIAVFIKFFVFADHNLTSSGTTTSSTSASSAAGVIINRDDLRKDDLDGDTRSSEAAAAAHKLNTILEKTYYDVQTHAPELLDWFTVLIAQAIQQLRADALVADNVYHLLNDFLQTLALPDFLDTILLTEIDVGDDFPIFSNCRIVKNKLGRLEAKIDVDLSDTLTLGIKTKLLLNHPRPLTAVLPVELSVSIVRFLACLSVSMFSDDEDDGTALIFSFGPDYRLEFTVKSFIGSRAKLQDVPKIGQLIESRLRKWFQDRCVEPKFQVVMLPSFWPRSKNTRERPQASTPE